MFGAPFACTGFHAIGPVADLMGANGQEQPVGPATVTSGSLLTSFTAYQPRTFAIKLDWAAGSSEYKLYTLDTVTNQDETA